MGFTQTIFLTKRYGGFTKKKTSVPKKAGREEIYHPRGQEK